jgi:hypothetical protein
MLFEGVDFLYENLYIIAVVSFLILGVFLNFDTKKEKNQNKFFGEYQNDNCQLTQIERTSIITYVVLLVLITFSGLLLFI